jgi:predicted anti-sigma-YlaC factor YlaD
MTEVDCTREAEILEAITTGRWAQGGDAELRAHAKECPACADLASVASAIAEESAVAMRQAHVPSSGLVWWRMQRRVQAESAENAKRAVSIVQVATLAATAFAVLVILGGLSLLKNWNQWMVTFTAPQWNMPLILAAATCLLLAPFAVYYAVTEE